MTSSGAITLRSDFDILRPAPSSTKPCVSTVSYGALPAPVALARHAPVRPRGDHVGDPLPPPRWDPAHAVDLRERPAAQVAALHADEPLLRGAEDDRVLAPPAVGVAVHEDLGGEERAHLAEPLDDARVGVEHAEARPLRHLGGEPPMGVDRRQHLEAVAEAGLVVLLPVPRGGVDEPGAALERDVVGEDDRDLARQPGVPAG